ncbi:MAG TPA: HD domain-containing phosphohydrolase [Thermodesulfobacteriota bacterium]|nr:HD domain-containing phosphohydrolase [Thermodesulfobacteriota bacterium]
MEQFKQLILRHFEKILVVVILMAAFIGTYLVEEKFIILNFYYLPVLTAGYFLGRRMGVLAAVFSILAVLICVLAFPQRFFGGKETLTGVAQLSSWGGFLILVSFTVGTLYEKNEQRVKELKNAYIGVLEILSKYLESTDRYTKGHSVRVSELATEIAIALGLPRPEVENIRVSGLLHDIGKIEISSEILSKAAALSTEEKEVMDLHTVKGAYILSAVGSVLKEVVPIVIAHHKYFAETLEHNNNGGTQKIPVGARVIAVADAYDAMTTDRPYRKGMPPWEAFQEIVAKTGKQFDPEVVEAFKRVVSEKLEGG